MKLIDLHLLAYGPFTDRHLDLGAGSEGLHVVFGPNEAGKSSALRALRALLFGVPERTRDDFRHGRTELRVGGVFRGADGTQLCCYRRKGRKNTLLDADGEPIPEERLTHLLGGVGEPLFERLFGIDHESLVSGGQALLVERGREAEALFGSGLGSTAVHKLRESLKAEAESLFAPRASKPVINAQLARLREIEHHQREASLSARHWDEARRTVNRATAELDDIDARLTRAEKRRSTLERIRRVLPGLARRARLRGELEALGAVPALEEDFAARRESAATRRRVAADSFSRTTSRLEGLRQQVGALDVSEALLAEAPTIDELRERLGSHRKANRERPDLVARRSTLLEQARQRLAEIRPDLPPERVEALHPLLAHRRRATELGGRRQALDSAVGKARETREEVAGKLAAKRDELGRLPPPVSRESLRRAVDGARRAGDVDGSIADAAAELARHEAACGRQLGSLGLWSGDLRELAGAPLPGEETLRRFAEAFQAIAEEQRGWESTMADARREEQQTGEALRAQSLAGAVPTEAELLEARDRRDGGWRLLRRHWIDGEDVSAESRSHARDEPLPEVFEADILRADDIADRLRRESGRVHEQATARAKLEACRLRAAESAAALREIAGRRETLERSWQDAWKGCGIAPLPPREMGAWLEKASRLREMSARGDELRSRLDGLQRVRESQRGNLGSALAVCGEPLTGTLAGGALGPLLDHAEAQLQSIDDTARHRSVLEETIAELDDSLRRLDRELEGAERERTAWASQWAALMSDLGREESASPGEVSDYLEAIAQLLRQVGEAGELRSRIDAMDEEARGFERDVKSLLTRLAPDLTQYLPAEAVLELHARLGRHREASSRRDTLAAQVREAEDEVREARATMDAAVEALGELCRQAGCDDAGALQAVEERFLEHRRLRDQLREVEDELIETGDGLGVEALEAEVASVDRDAVASELRTLEEHIERELRPARQTALEGKIEAERAFRSMAGSDEASALAEEAQQTLSELRGHAERYVRLKLAARVLRDEIESFRRRHRDPILSRASAYYATLTCGSLGAIETDFDEADQPVLVGVRPAGERLRVEAMSTGTRDQLYLALRLATLEHYVESSEPLPFIVDDILVQFDDERARATLGALAEFSARAQVILFTHHRRVAEAADRLDGGAGRVFVHELG